MEASAPTGPTAPMTAADLQAVLFHERRWRAAGYDQDEVDEFIDRLAAQTDALLTRVHELEAANDRLRRDHRDTIESTEDSVRILDAARKTAEATIADADQYRARIRSEADAMMAEADQRMEATNAAIAGRHAEAEQQLRDLRQRMHAEIRRFLQETIDRLGLGSAPGPNSPSGGAPQSG